MFFTGSFGKSRFVTNKYRYIYTFLANKVKYVNIDKYTKQLLIKIYFNWGFNKFDYKNVVYFGL